jgi:hypothetical protein
VKLSFLLTVLAPVAVFAQSAELGGIVLDPSGLAVSNAAVRIRSIETGIRLEATTNNEGAYSFVGLKPGAYSASVQAPGFKTAARDGISLAVAQRARLDFMLEVGSLQDSVTVTGGSEMLQTTDASVSTVVGRKFVENVPLNGRTFQSLVLLSPGVVTNSPQQSATAGFAGEFSINGQRAETNRYTVDGISANNGAYVNGYGAQGQTGSLPAVSAVGTTQSMVSVDALQEFRVETSSYSAEYGRQPGGQFMFLTRSGTNQVHGTGFDYLRNDVLDATNWFNNYYQTPKQKERANDFGLTVGAPLTVPRLYQGRDRTFFFFSYEGMRLGQPLAATIAYVPSMSLRQQAGAPLRPVLNGFPQPNAGDLSNGLSQYLLSATQPGNIDAASLRLDHTVGPWLRLFFRFSRTDSRTASRIVQNPAALRGIVQKPASYTAGLTSMLTTRVSNEFRLGYSSNEGGVFYTLTNIGGAQPVDLNGLQGVDVKAHPSAYVIVNLNFAGYSSFLATYDVRQPQNQWNVTDSLSYATGNHLFKFGLDYLQTGSTLHPYDPVINTSFNSAAAVISNTSYQAYISIYGTAYPVYKNFSLFVQDEWRVRPRLTLSMGLRGELNPPVSVSQGILPYIVSGDLNNPSSLTLAPKNTRFYASTYHNFAPRLGVSYVLRNNSGSETVVRAGGGVFFDTGQQVSSNNFPSSPGLIYTKYYGTNYGSAASFPLTPAQLNVSLDSSFIPPYGNLFTYDRHMQLPYTLQWNTSVQQALGAAQTFTVSYVGAVARRLQQRNQYSLASLSPTFTTVSWVRSGLTSDYHALQLQFQRRLARGIQALSSYTWSHAIDYGSRDASLPYQRGNSDFDVRHSFTTAVSADIPARVENSLARALIGHWGTDFRFSARSGFPVPLQGNQLTNPATGDQFYGGLNVAVDQPLYLYGPQYPGGRAVNPAAFSLPTGIQVGNAPRNFVRGFDAVQLDLNLRRDFPIHERARLQFRAEMFNVLNHAIFGLVNTTFGNELFGRATATLNGSLSGSLGGVSGLYQQGGPRSVQFALKLVF